jgi:hypothetical protein
MIVEKSDKSKMLDMLVAASETHKAAKKTYEDEANTWWEDLSYDDKLRAFYSVVQRIHDGDITQQGSYRYVLYDVFGFGPDAYGLGMECGYMSLHNSIMNAEEEQIIHDYYKSKNKVVKTCSNKDAEGNCHLHNLFCNYPECEET